MLEIFPVHRGEVESLVQPLGNSIRRNEPPVIPLEVDDRRDWGDAMQVGTADALKLTETGSRVNHRQVDSLHRFPGSLYRDNASRGLVPRSFIDSSDKPVEDDACQGLGMIRFEYFIQRP